MAKCMTRVDWADLKLRFGKDLSQEGIIVRYLMGLVSALKKYTKHQPECPAVMNCYRLPTLEEARKDWEAQYGLEGSHAHDERTGEAVEDDEQWSSSLENLGKRSGVCEAGS